MRPCFPIQGRRPEAIRSRGRAGLELVSLVSSSYERKAEVPTWNDRRWQRKADAERLRPTRNGPRPRWEIKTKGRDMKSGAFLNVGMSPRGGTTGPPLVRIVTDFASDVDRSATMESASEAWMAEADLEEPGGAQSQGRRLLGSEKKEQESPCSRSGRCRRGCP